MPRCPPCTHTRTHAHTHTHTHTHARAHTHTHTHTHARTRTRTRTQVIQLLEKPRDPPLQYVFVDTPGQIEIFTWSASGQLVTGVRVCVCVSCMAVCVCVCHAWLNVSAYAGQHAWRFQQ
jgi:hypothetical protein